MHFNVKSQASNAPIYSIYLGHWYIWTQNSVMVRIDNQVQSEDTVRQHVCQRSPQPSCLCSSYQRRCYASPRRQKPVFSEKACISYSSRAARTQTIGSAISLSTFLETVASSMFVLSWIQSLRERIVYAVYSDFAAVRSGSRS